MLRSIHPSILRTSPADGAPGHEAPSDPAGFSSLLRQQTQAVAPPTPSASPAPSAPAAAPQQAARPAGHDAPAATREAAKPKSEGDDAPEHGSEATENSESADAAQAPGRPRGWTSRPKLRNAEAAPRAAGSDPEANGEKSAAGVAPVSTAADTTRTATSATTHAAVAEWLAALQQQRSSPVDKTTTAAGETTDGEAASKKKLAAVQGDPPAADAATSNRQMVPVERGDAAPAFVALLAEHRDEPAARAESPSSTAPVGAAGIAAPPSIAREAAAPVAVALATPIDAPDFAQALGLQMSVLAKDGVQKAELHLNPADMGPVSVQIVMDGTQARIDFGADVAATRQAIEAGLPELASALRDAGYTLAGGGVSQHAGQRSQGGDSAPSDGGTRRGAGKPASDDSVTRVGIAARRIVSRGGVDLYA